MRFRPSVSHDLGPATDHDLLEAIAFEVYDDVWRVYTTVVAVRGVGKKLTLAVEYVHRVIRGNELVPAVPIEICDDRGRIPACLTSQVRDKHGLLDLTLGAPGLAGRIALPAGAAAPTTGTVLRSVTAAPCQTGEAQKKRDSSSQLSPRLHHSPIAGELRKARRSVYRLGEVCAG